MSEGKTKKRKVNKEGPCGMFPSPTASGEPEQKDMEGQYMIQEGEELCNRMTRATGSLAAKVFWR